MKMMIAVAVLGVIAGCDRPIHTGNRYDVGDGIVAWYLPNGNGGFLPWRFRVNTPGGDSPSYVVLERRALGKDAQTLLEAPLPATSDSTSVTVNYESGHLVLTVGKDTKSSSVELPLLRNGTSREMNPYDPPQDRAGAIVLSYTFPANLKEPPSFEKAQRLPDSEYLCLRFEVRRRG